MSVPQLRTALLGKGLIRSLINSIGLADAVSLWIIFWLGFEQSLLHLLITC